MPSIRDATRSDPLGAGIVVCGVAIAVLAIFTVADPADIELPAWQWPDVRLPSILYGPKPVPRPLESPPTRWRALARPGDVLAVPGLPVAYWGRPDAKYGAKATNAATKPIAIVVHFTDDRPAINLIRQQHEGDKQRGGFGFGYHFYIDKDGRVLQGAPLTVRTNHIKPHTAPEHRKGGPALDNENTISVSLVGACRSPRFMPISYRCGSETVTDQQMDAGLATVKALQKMYGLKCAEIYGHGDLQKDRQEFEGVTLSRRVRSECAIATASVPNG